LLAARLTHPYQIIIGPEVQDQAYLRKLLTIVTSANPYTPLEMVFIEPTVIPDTQTLLSAVRLHRPHYLDNDQRFLFPRPGNRAVLFTLVTQDPEYRFFKEMQRQVFWWRHPVLPTSADLEALSKLDGVLIDIDTRIFQADLLAWQDRFEAMADDIPLIGFSDVLLQKRWTLKTTSYEYAERILNYHT
jgi:hypothetical protein